MNRMAILGTGFEIVNFPTEIVLNEGVSEKQITEEARHYAYERSEILKMRCGNFIYGCTEIDNTLGEAISSFFFKDNTDPDKRGQFHDFIMDTSIFSFIKKKKVLQSIMEKFPQYFPLFNGRRRQEMFDKINYLIKMRNAFAHGILVINYGERTESLSYYDSWHNQQEEITLTKELFKQWNKDIAALSFEILECIPSEQVHTIGTIKRT